MKYFVVVASAVLIVSANASAQDEVGSVEPAATAETPPKEADSADDEDKRSPYYKKVGGLLRIEGGAGPSRYNADQTVSSDVGAGLGKLNGPEYTLSAGVGLGGFFIGGGFRWADYSAYNLLKVGLVMQGIFRFIPYVHPMIRINLFYAGTRDGSPISGFTVDKSNGGGFTLGAGIRVPIVRWVSFAATFDWSMIGLGLTGNDTSGSRETTAIVGQQLTGMFALTFQFIGVRSD